MADPRRSVNCCLSAAVHYEHQAKRAADPTAQRKFLDVAAKWRQLAQDDRSREHEASARSSKGIEPEQSAPKRSGALEALEALSRLFGKLGVAATGNVDQFAKVLRQGSRVGGFFSMSIKPEEGETTDDFQAEHQALRVSR